MKVLFVIATLLAAALAEDMTAAESYPVASYSVGPAVSSSSAGNAYGAHGARSAGYGAYGRSNYGDSGLYSDKASAARGQHNIGAARAYDAYGAQASNYGRYKNVGAYAQDKISRFGNIVVKKISRNIGAARSLEAYGAKASKYGKYRNVGAYAQDKGDGYEKAYAYDKKAGRHAVVADYGARSGQYGVQDKKAYHNVGDYARAGHDRYGSNNRYGSKAYGVQAHDNSNYGNYGRSGAQSYKLAPAVSSYTAPAAATYAAPAAASYGRPAAASYGSLSRY